jgi:hypothetical protein
MKEMQLLPNKLAVQASVGRPLICCCHMPVLVLALKDPQKIARILSTATLVASTADLIITKFLLAYIPVAG